MSDGAVTFLVSRLAVASVEFLIVGSLVALLLACLPNIGPRWRRRIWFVALCKPFITIATGSLNGLVPLAPMVNGSLLGELLFPTMSGTAALADAGTPSLALTLIVHVWFGATLFLLVRIWLRAAATRQTAEDHLAKGYLLKPTTLRRLDPTLTVPPNARIIVTPEDAGPATLGVFQPAILIPESLLPWVIHHRDPSPAERARFCQVLRHELAHVSNRDDLLTLTTMVMLCFFWFHPMAHWAYRRVRMNNELCCDEDVVKSGVHPTDYVDTLMSIVAGNFSRRGFAMHLLGDSSPAGVLRRRLAYVLRERAHRESRPVWAWATLLLVALAMPRFLGYGGLVEVRMRTGETRLITRVELDEMGPALIERVLTPGVVDDAWYAAPYVYANAAPPMPGDVRLPGFNLFGVLGLDPTTPDPAATIGVSLPPDATLLADATDEVAAANSDDTADASAPAPKRKSRGAGWGPAGTPPGAQPPSAPILPPPSDRR
jgi:beta-lactamase regulating signal transducer with metallopeptidase domain